MQYRVIDAHLHCSVGSVGLLLRAMDLAEVERAVLLAWPGEAKQLMEEADREGGRRLRVAVAPDLSLVGTPEWDEELTRTRRLLAYASAIKLYKNACFGLNDAQGHQLDFMAPALEPLWSLAQDFGKPVIMHCADPADFWKAGPGLRKRQLEMHPEWRYYEQSQITSREWILSRRAYLVRRWPDVRFVGAHLGGFPVSPAELAHFMTFGPVDTSAALEEVLTQNRPAIERIFTRHYRNIMWGSDLIFGPVRQGRDSALVKISAKFLRDSLRMLVSPDPMPTPNPMECPWTVTGLDLSDALAERIFWTNAVKLFWKDEEDASALL